MRKKTVTTKTLSRKTNSHSAYWYAYHNGWTHSEAKSLAAKYWDMHTYRPRNPDMFERMIGADSCFDSTFNPLMLAAFAMVDIGSALRETCERLADPEERAKRRAEFARELRILRRPFYYARETERRRVLAAERRKLHRRRTLSPMPTPEALLDAWKRRKESRERMIVLGGMLHDLECYVDNCLRFDADGNVVGRNGGIRGWLKANLPELSPKYKTLMRYKAMAIRLRQATGTADPTPTEKLLREEPKREFIAELLAGAGNTFKGLLSAIEFEIDPHTVLADRQKVVDGICPHKVLAERPGPADEIFPHKVLAEWPLAGDRKRIKPKTVPAEGPKAVDEKLMSVSSEQGTDGKIFPQKILNDKTGFGVGAKGVGQSTRKGRKRRVERKRR